MCTEIFSVSVTVTLPDRILEYASHVAVYSTAAAVALHQRASAARPARYFSSHDEAADRRR
eukprot:2103837-Amphidinium_carterae.1